MIGLYHGISAGSKVRRIASNALRKGIQFRSWDQEMHAAWLREDGSGWEALMSCGCIYVEHTAQRHTPGTIVDLYEFWDPVRAEWWPLSPQQQSHIETFFRVTTGRPYDTAGLIGFVTRREQSAGTYQRAFFCSEWAAAGCMACGRKPLNLPAWKIFPAMFKYSPILRLRKRMITTDGGWQEYREPETQAGLGNSWQDAAIGVGA